MKYIQLYLKEDNVQLISHLCVYIIMYFFKLNILIVISYYVMFFFYSKAPKTPKHDINYFRVTTFTLVYKNHLPVP